MFQLRPLPLPSAPAPSRLLSSCAVAAIAIGVLNAPAVRAQGFQGTGTVVGGTAVGTITTPAPGQTTITINTSTNPRAIINWTPTDTGTGGGAIDFLPAGNTALFQGNNNSITNFTILNRILPADSSRQVALNGGVISRTSSDGGTLGRGNIWFYSPGGILAGPTSQFFVGGLLLSANNLADADFLDGDNSFTFASAPGSTAAVEISAGAQLAAAGPNSYVALIAPRVHQSGTVTVNGTAAYVAAEQVDVTINGTLFDIGFTTGTGVNGTTEDDAAVAHDGITNLVDLDSFEDGYGGSVPGGARHAIVAAVPKNDAITMLVTGSINYTPAAVAFEIDNRVVLAAGYNVSNGGFGSAAPAGAVTNAFVGGLNYDSDVFVGATGTATVGAAGPTANFAGNVVVGGIQGASFIANGSTVTVGGDVSLDSSAEAAAAGNVLFQAIGGADVTIGGSLALVANSYSGSFASGTAPAVVNAGSARMIVNGATVDVGSDLALAAFAIGAGGTVGGADVTAGTVSIEMGNSGTLTVDGGLGLTATAEGGRSTTGDSVSGGNATGGSASITSTGGTISVDGGMTISTRAVGGEVGYGASPTGGTAQAGSITVGVGAGQLAVLGDTQFDAIGYGGYDFSENGGSGGAGTGGTISVAAGSGGQLNFAGNLLLFADGEGGYSINGAGAVGTGGSVSLTTGTGGTISVDNETSGTAIGRGGNAGTTAGSAQGGIVSVNFAGGSLVIGDTADRFGRLTLDAGARGGNGNNQGGNAQAGDVTVTGGTNGSLSVGDLTQLAAQAVGGFTGAGTGGGGDATAGGITVTLGTGSTATFGSLLIVYGDAEGGYGGAGLGGDATGGDILIDAAGGGIEIGDPAYGFETTVTLNASALGGEAFGGGGNAQGGSAILRLGTVADGTVGGSIFITAAGFGGRASGSASGDGTGGIATVEVNGPASFGGGIELYVEGRGGRGIGGSGTGGTATFATTGGAVTLNGELRLDADGERGDIDSFVGGVAPGDGTGGTIMLSTAGPLSTNGSSIFLTAAGIGGEEFLDGGAEGGVGSGGSVNANFAGGVTASQIIVDVNGYGGRGFILGDTGQAGGAAIGGDAAISFGGTTSVNDLSVNAYAYGGTGGDTGGTAAGVGGAATGGIIQANIDGDFTANSIFLATDGYGGRGGYGSTESGSSAGGAGGAATGGSAVLQVGFSGAASVLTNSLGLYAYADGGRGEAGTDGGNGGFAQGGTARLSIASGTVQTSFVDIEARAQGGDGGGVFDVGTQGSPGGATGGNVTLEIMSGASLSTFGLQLEADGEGGFSSNFSGTSNPGGDGTGGTATLRLAEGSLLEVSNFLNVSVGGEGGFSPTAGSGFGGTIVAEFGGTADIGGDVRLIAEGMGGGGSQAGNGTGGNISIAITGDVEVGSGGEGFGLIASAAGGGGFAFGSSPLVFGNGTGGSITFNLGPAASLQLDGTVDLYADGAGYENCYFCSSFGAPGGNGTGGTVDVTLDGAIFDTSGEINRPLFINANGFGGFGNQQLGATGRNGGDGIGGTVTLKLGNGASTDSTIAISVIGQGGNAGFGFGGEGCCGGNFDLQLGGPGDGPVIFASTPFTGAGGDGVGGSVSVIADGSSVTLDSLDVSARGIGGEGARGFPFSGPDQLNGGNGGSGTGGSITLRAEDGGELRLRFSNLEVTGEGGRGGDGSETGYGGMTAGRGGNGGTGTGGSIQVSVSDSSIIFESGLYFDASGFGGEGGFGGFNFFDDGYGSYAGGAGGNGGAGFGGSVALDITGGFITAPPTSESGTLAPLEIYAIGQGGDGGFGGSSSTGPSGDDGFGGMGTGGVVSLSVADLSTAGVGRFGATFIEASGREGFGSFDPDNTASTELAGRVTITDTAAAPDGGFSFDSLSVQIGGADNTGTEFSLTSSAGPVRVLSSFFLTLSGQAEFVGTGDGGLSATGDIYIEADRITLSQTAPAPGGATLSGNNVTLFSFGDIDGATGSIMAAADATLFASGAITLGSAVAGDDFIAEADGTITVTSALTTGLGPDTGESGYGAGDGSNIRLRGGGAVRLDDGSAVNLVELSSSGDSVFSDGLITAESLSVSTAVDIALNDLDITNDIGLFAENGSITGNNFMSGRDVSLLASGDVTLAAGSIGGGLFVSAQNVTLGDIVTTGAFLGGDNGGGIQVAANGTTSIASADSATFIEISATSVTGGTLTAANSIFVGTFSESGGTGAIDIDDATAGGFVRLSADGDVDTGVLTAGQDVVIGAGGAVTIAGAVAGRDLLIDANGAIVSGAATAGDDIEANGAAITFASATTTGLGEDTSESGYGAGDGSNIRLTGTGAIMLGAANAADDVVIVGASLTQGGPITAGNDISVNTLANVTLDGATAGRDLRVDSGGAVTVSGGSVGRNVQLTGVGDVRLDDGSASGSIALTSTGGAVRSDGTITANTLSIDAATDIAVNNLVIATAIALNATGSISGGTFTTNGNVSLDATNAVTVDTIDAGGSIDIAADTITADSLFASNAIILAGRLITFDQANAGGLFDLTTTSDFTFGDLVAGAISIEAASIAANSLTSGNTVDLDATVGSITVGSIDAGGTVRLASAGDISLGDVVARGDFLADASGTFTADSIVTLAGEGGNQPPPPTEIGATAADPEGNGVSIASAGDVTVGTINSAGGVILQSANGDVLVTTDLVAAGPVDAFGQNVTLNALGSLGVRTAQATAGEVLLNVGGLLSLSGAVTGTQITLVSSDIAVGSGALVGTAAGTQSIVISANGGSSPVQLGGATSGQGYTLDNAEFSRFAGRDISFSTNGPLQIGTLNIRGAGASNPNLLGTLTVDSNSAINVTGRVALDNATAANGLSIRSGNLLFVDIAGGGISILDGAGALTGSLNLDGRSILVSTVAAANDLQNAATVAARDARLGTNDGAVNEAGVIRAGSIRLASSSGRIHVQNTGGATNDSRAGLSAGAGGITLVNTNDGGVEVIINGRQTSGGQTFTGQALIARLTLQGFGQGNAALADGSTVNGCLFSATSCGFVPPPPPPPPPPIFRPDPNISTSVGDVIQEIVEGEDSDTRPPDIAFNELISIEQAVLAPIIDEPVTGTGNEDVYSGFQEREEDEEGEGSVDQQVTGSGNDTLINQPGGDSQNAPATNDEQVTGSGNDVREDGDGD